MKTISNNTQADIGLVVAMKEEANFLASALGLAYQQIDSASYAVYVNKNKSLVMITPGVDINYAPDKKPINRVGKVSAGIITTVLIKDYNPKIIINCGTAGGVGSGIKVGDLIIADYVTNHDMQFPTSVNNLWAQRKIQIKNNYKLKFLKSQFKLGTVTSSESFTTSAEEWKLIHINKAIAKDMEAAGFVQALEIMNYKNPYFVIKSITDITDIDIDEKLSYENFQNNFKLAVNNLSGLIKEIIFNRKQLL
jgi:adenosylhomocysteine nucleosidase